MVQRGIGTLLEINELGAVVNHLPIRISGTRTGLSERASLRRLSQKSVVRRNRAGTETRPYARPCVGAALRGTADNLREGCFPSSRSCWPFSRGEKVVPERSDRTG